MFACLVISFFAGMTSPQTRGKKFCMSEVEIFTRNVSNGTRLTLCLIENAALNTKNNVR